MDYTDRIPQQEPEDKLDAFLTALAAERKRALDLADKVMCERERALVESNYYQLKDELDHAKQNEQMFYDSIKTLALARQEAGQTLPAEVKVKLFKGVNIASEILAREWCSKNLTSCLKLDAEKFEKAVKIGMVPDEIACVYEEKRAQVASDLSRYE